MDTPPDRPDVTDRGNPPHGFLTTGWPLAAAALILLMLVRACMPVSSPTPPAAASANGASTSS